MGVYVAAGQIAAPSANNTGSVLCTSDAQEVLNLNPAPPSGTDRYDVIICRPRGQDLDGGANDDFIFDFVSGTAAASPTVPATPAGCVALANVRVRGGSATVAAGDVADVRTSQPLAVYNPATLPTVTRAGWLKAPFTNTANQVTDVGLPAVLPVSGLYTLAIQGTSTKVTVGNQPCYMVINLSASYSASPGTGCAFAIIDAAYGANGTYGGDQAEDTMGGGIYRGQMMWAGAMVAGQILYLTHRATATLVTCNFRCVITAWPINLVAP